MRRARSRRGGRESEDGGDDGRAAHDVEERVVIVEGLVVTSVCGWKKTAADVPRVSVWL